MLSGQVPSTALEWLPGAMQVASEFAGHLLLLGELLFVVAVVLLGVGKGLGLPYLFWHEDPSKQTIAGFASVMLASELTFMSYLLSPRHMAEQISIQGYLLQGGAALLALVVPLSLVARLARRRRRVHPKNRSFFIAGALIGVTTTALLVLGGAVLERPISTWACERLPARVTGRFPPGRCVEHMHLHVLAVLFVIALLAVYMAGARRMMGAQRIADTEADERARLERMWPSPVVGLCVALALVAAGWSFFEFWLHGIHPLIPIAVTALLLWLAGRDAYKLRFLTLARFYDKDARVPLAGYETRAAGTPGGPGLIDLRSIPWANAGAPWTGGKRPLVLVCASGGGLRAAVWTTAILCELERTLPAFPYHVRIVSGASGGMVGATCWAATLRPPPERLPEAGAELHTVKLRQLVKDVACESLSAVIHALVYRDLPFALLPWNNAWDRGIALEEAFACSMPRAFRKKTLGDLWQGEAEGWQPSLVYSPMIVEDGRRLLISNLDLEPLLVQSGPRIGQGEEALYSHAGYEFARLFPACFKGFPLATAARISASFPYVSPSSVLPTEPRRRVVDAGYWDNYGVTVACGFLFECLKGGADAPMRRWLEDNVSGVLLVQIRDGVSTLSAEGAPRPSRAKRLRARRTALGSLTRGLEWLTTPVTALFSAREGAMMFRNDEQVEAVGAMFAAKHGDGFFTTVTFSFNRQASLSWYLTEREKRLLSRQAGNLVKAKAEALQQWWDDKTTAARSAQR